MIKFRLFPLQIQRRRNTRYIHQDVNIKDFVTRIICGERISLSKAITLAESSRADDKSKFAEIMNEICVQLENNRKSYLSFRIGVCGPPGAGVQL